MAHIAPCLGTLRNQYNEKYPGRNKASDGWIGDAAHASRASDHNPNSEGVVCAVDITHDPARGLDCNLESEKVIKDARVHYVIWARRIRYQGGAWQPYSGSNPHTLHMHVSTYQEPAKYNDGRTWNLNTQGGLQVNDKFKNEAEVKPFYMLLRGNEATLEERKGWIGRAKMDFITSPNTAIEARNRAEELARLRNQKPAQTVISDPTLLAKAAKYDAIKEALR